MSVITEQLHASTASLPAAPDIDKLPGGALLTDGQKAALSGFSVAAFKKWRREGGQRGPATIYVEGRPRTTVRAYREWIAGAQRVAS